ncbi:MAG: hypothetical protein JJLCMIEE_00264 [Acidimicrobiales bacterium]|nr:hypothetical protein [Acidimicrobiales bacterium]
MVDSTTTDFIRHEVSRLEPFDFVAISPVSEPLDVVEVTADEDGRLVVRIPGRPSPLPEVPPAMRAALTERGFSSADPANPAEPWEYLTEAVEEAVAASTTVMAEVYRHNDIERLDITHGSHRQEHETELRLDALRERIEKLLTDLLGHPPPTDSDGDYQYSVGDTLVVIAPRPLSSGRVALRVFAVTNVGVAVTPELGLFLARLNFGISFGRFVVDPEHQAIWVDETLLGEETSAEELRFICGTVARIAAEWDERIKQLFGGATYRDVLQNRTDAGAPESKPGLGGYL